MRNLILNIPHSSINGIFDETIGKWFPTPFFINDCVREHTDWFTDVLFRIQDTNINGIKAIVFPYSRFVCDIDRVYNDPKEEIGQGIIYKKFKGYKRGELTQLEIEKILTLRANHIDKLKESLTENSILIDCHSFSNRKEKNMDIYISFNDGYTCDLKINEIIEREFRKHGYSIEYNCHCSKPIMIPTNFKYSAIRIEVNKRIYMNESLLTMNYNPRQWMRWYGCLKGIYKKISS